MCISKQAQTRKMWLKKPSKQSRYAATGYRYGFNGKEKDNKDGVVQYDYGFRIYDPRLVRFKSVDPLTKGYPMLTPYQFASNSPIANIDLDGGEAKYYSIVITENYDAKGKLTLSTKTTTYEKSKEAGWFTNGKIYQSAGKIGDGTLYSVYKVKNYAADKDGLEHSEISKIGSIYVSPPPTPSPDRPTSSLSIGLQIFGSGYDPDASPASNANPDAKIISFNYKEFQEVMEPVLLGMDVKNPWKLEPPSLDELIEHAGEAGLDKALKELEKKWEAKEANAKKEKAENTIIFCSTCNTKYRDSSGLEVPSNKPATDTASDHNELDKKLKKNN